MGDWKIVMAIRDGSSTVDEIVSESIIKEEGLFSLIGHTMEVTSSLGKIEFFLERGLSKYRVKLVSGESAWGILSSKSALEGKDGLEIFL